MEAAEYSDVRLRDALTRALPGRLCPICLVLQTQTYDRLRGLQYEAANNEQVGSAIVSAGGYCHFHFWYLERLASPVTNARLLERLLVEINEKWIQAALSDGARTSSRSVRCPVCGACSRWEKLLVETFAEKMAEKDFRLAYQTSIGLCLPHLPKVLDRLDDAESRAFLLQSAHRQLDEMIHDLRLMLAKWRSRDHTPGRDNNSSYRAIAKLVGGRHWSG